MNVGDAVKFKAKTGKVRSGRIVALRPGDMVDVEMDDSGRVERRAVDRLEPVEESDVASLADTENDIEYRAVDAAREKAEKLRQVREGATKARTAAKRPGKTQAVDVGSRLWNRGAVMFSRPDPPRQGQPGAVGGNPIDGVAYYIVVDNTAISTGRWLTQEDVARAILRYNETAKIKMPTSAEQSGKSPVGYALGVQAFVKDYLIPQSEQFGNRIYARDVGPEKYIRVKGGAGQRGLGPEHLIKQKKAEPASQRPDPKIAYFSVKENGEPQFYYVSSTGSPGKEKLRNFSAYTYRSFRVGGGPIARAIAAASRGDVHPDIAAAFCRSGMVQKRHGKFVEPVIDAEAPTAAGETVALFAGERAESPFFSWVPTILPPGSSNELNPVLSREDKETITGLKILQRLLAGLDNALSAVRTMIEPAIDGQPLRAHAGAKTLVRLARALASLLRYTEQLQTRAMAGDAVADRVFSAYENNPLRPTDPKTPFGRALRMLASHPDSQATRWLLERDEAGEFTSALNSREAVEATVTSLLSWLMNPAYSGPLIGRAAISWGLGQTLNPYWDFPTPEILHGAPEGSSAQRLLGTPQKNEVLRPGTAAAQRFGAFARVDSTVPPGWPYSAAAQSDVYWGLLSLLDANPNGNEVAEAVGVLLLWQVVGGYSLSGGLRDGGNTKGLLDQGRRALYQEELRLLGGTAGLGSAGNYTVYMTYNPVLYETTRLYWPHKGENLAFGSILAHPRILADIDQVGVYGSMMSLAQEAAAVATSRDEYIATLAGWTRGAASQLKTADIFLSREPAAFPALRLRNLGDPASNLGRTIDDFWVASMRAIKSAKDRVATALLRTANLLRQPRNGKTPIGDMPRLPDKEPAYYQGEDGFTPSSLHTLRQAEQVAQLDALRRLIDEELARLG